MTKATDPPGQDAFEITGKATELNVRAILTELDQRLRDCGLKDDFCGSISLAVSEALNNITEHAYAGAAPGPITLSAALSQDHVTIKIRDAGRALPENRPPQASLPDNSGPRATLPEGGFGWYLIHSLVQNLRYERKGDENVLYLSFSPDHCPK